MTESIPVMVGSHSHVFLGAGHEKNERKTWAAISLAGLMMVGEVVGGTLFGSLAVVADGLHMATHALALLIAALAYTYARRHAADTRFAFGTGKLGDLAGYSSAIILAMIALLIGYEAIARLRAPVPIHFNEAIPIAIVGLLVNIATAWLLSGGDHGHAHGHHGHDDGGHHDAAKRVQTTRGIFLLEVFEDGVPPRFRLRLEGSAGTTSSSNGLSATVETDRPSGQKQTFQFADRGAYLESIEEIPEPHEFKVRLLLTDSDGSHAHEVDFVEHVHGASGGVAERDNNLRAAFVHVLADAAVSVLAITGLLLGRFFGWVWMDPAMGIVGALVITNWAYGLVRDTGGVLLDITPDEQLAAAVRREIERGGDQLADLHLWRLGPGHLGAIVSVLTSEQRGPDFYRALLGRFPKLSHVTIEVRAS